MITKNSIFALAAMTSLSQGAVLVNYQFSDPSEYNLISGSPTSARVTWNATSVATGAAASIYQGVGLQLFANGSLNTAFTSAAGAANLRANPGDYETFTLSANPGSTLDLENITFDLTAGGANTAYHVDAYADGGSAVTLLASTTTDGPFDLDLTGFGDDVESIEFRIVMDVYTTSNLQIDNVVVNGEIVAVPEPSSTALLGLGGLALILRRRRA